MTTYYKIGDTITWDYRGTSKTGTVSCVVERGTRPSGWSGLRIEAAARDHVSYVVKVDGVHYWPRVNKLRKVEP